MDAQTVARRNPVGKFYDRTLGRCLPSSRLLGVLLCLLLNSVVYWGAQAITRGWSMHDMTTALDRAIPFAPGWTVVYVGAYLFWAVGYVVMARGPEWYRIMTAEVLAKLLCGAVFLLLPTTNVRPEILGDGLGAPLLRLIYRADAPTNLFPSIHCLESWICFAGLRSWRHVPCWYRVFSGVFAGLVCISTLATRQHVIADVISGVLLAEGTLRLSRRLGWGRRLERVCLALDRRLFSK